MAPSYPLHVQRSFERKWQQRMRVARDPAEPGRLPLPLTQGEVAEAAAQETAAVPSFRAAESASLWGR